VFFNTFQNGPSKRRQRIQIDDIFTTIYTGKVYSLPIQQKDNTSITIEK